MAHSTSTTNYKLSQFAGSDKPAWLADYNADMLAIDTNLKSVSDTASGASTAIPSIQADLDNVEVTANSAESKSTSALSNIAKTYNATSTYSVGDKVLYNNLLYKCIIPISTAESFDGTKWKRVLLDEIITDLDKIITDLNSKLTEWSNNLITPLASGQYIDIEYGYGNYNSMTKMADVIARISFPATISAGNNLFSISAKPTHDIYINLVNNNGDIIPFEFSSANGVCKNMKAISVGTYHLYISYITA